MRLTVEAYLVDWVEAVTPSLAVTASSNYRLLIRCYVVPQQLWIAGCALRGHTPSDLRLLCRDDRI